MHEESDERLCQNKAFGHYQMEYSYADHHDRTEDDRADAGRFKGENLPWIECHAGIVDVSVGATALIWIMGFKARCRGACAGRMRSDEMAHEDTDKDAEWDTLRMELMDTLAVSELPDTSMTCATLRALLDILSINMTRAEAKALIASSLNAFGD